jgi:hypothetical protein
LQIFITIHSTVLGFLIAFLILGFEISRNRFGKYALNFFYNNNKLKRLLSLLVATLVICVLEYSTNFDKANFITIIYFILCLSLIIIVIVVPTIFSLFKNVISDEFITNEVSKIKTWDVILENGSPTIDACLESLTLICIQQIKNGETKTASLIIGKITDKHFEVIQEILSIAHQDAHSININRQISFISSFVWKNIIEESIRQNDGTVAFTLLSKVYQYIKILVTKKADKNCLNELFISIADINQLLVGRGLHIVIDKEMILLSDLLKTILKVDLDTTDPDEIFAIRPRYQISLFSLLFEFDFLIYQILTDLAREKQYQKAMKILEFYDECWVRIDNSSLADEVKYKLQRKILEELTSMHIYIIDKFEIPLVSEKENLRLPSLREIGINHPHIIEIIDLLRTYIVELAKRNILTCGTGSVVHALYLIGINACTKIYSDGHEKIIKVILKTYCDAFISSTNQKQLSAEFNKDINIFIRKLEEQNSNGNLDKLIIDLKLVRNKF